jgi:hypothetical protein
MSTRPLAMKLSRFADTVSTHSIFPGSMPSLPAMILPTSTSKPSGSSVSRLMLPSPGWSNLVPILMAPASARRAMVEPAGNSAVSSTSGSGVPDSSSPPQPVATRANAANKANHRRMKCFMK